MMPGAFVLTPGTLTLKELRALIAARARQDGLGPRWSGIVRAVALSPDEQSRGRYAAP